MQLHRTLVILVGAGVLVFGGCERAQPNYCPTAHDNNCLEIDAAVHPGCLADRDCTGANKVCDVNGSKTCVQCTPAEPAACVGTTPICSANYDCQSCASHTQCTLSNACLSDGSCADPGSVAYIDPSGSDNAVCSKMNPCTKVASALATNRPYVKFHGVIDEPVSISGGRVVTFLGDPNAALTRSTGSGAIVTIQDNNTSLSIYDLTIRDAPNSASGIGCVIPTASGAPSLSLTRVSLTNNPGGGISVSGGSLNVAQSTITGNQGGGISASGGSLTLSRSTIASNQGGGVVMSGSMVTFAITNNFIYRNGNDVTASAGGLFLLPSSTSKLEFNTIVDNTAKVATTSAGGVFCDQVGFTASHNLIFRNSGGMAGNVQTVGICGYGDSFNMPGTSNVDNGPGFVHPNATPFDYHLTSMSPPTIVNAAGPCTGVDFDGDTRPIGAACDEGADEYKP